MKDINDVIAEVVRRTGFSEDVAAAVVRSAILDCREFMERKQGYSFYFPRFGTFHFRVTAIRPFIERQRRYMAYWLYRLQIGEAKQNARTIEAATINIGMYRTKIKNTLLIKDEFLKDHAYYNEWKARLLNSDTLSVTARLEELYDVEVLKQEFAARYKGQEDVMPELPDE
jgi:hypothetical protein